MLERAEVKHLCVALLIVMFFITSIAFSQVPQECLQQTLKDKKMEVLIEPVWLKGPRKTIYPQSPQPVERLYVFDAFDCDVKTKTLLNTAQGVINAQIPRFYLILQKPPETAAAKEDLKTKHDLVWLNWLVHNNYIKEPQLLSSVQQVLDTFKIKKVILVDPDFPASLNIATMIASLKGLPVAYPEQVEEYNLEVVEDLKGRWKTNIEAYSWAFDNLWPQMDHSTIAVLSPTPDISHLRDYLVAKKIFTFWITGAEDGDNNYSSPSKEKDAIGQILGKMPVNIPIIGFPWHGGDEIGIGEGPGVKLFSRYAKFLVPINWKANLSVWTGLKAKTKTFRQPPPRDITLDYNKVYVTLLVSDGDNLNTWFDYFPKYWQSPHRGKIPIAWTMGPTLVDLQAPLLDYYYSTMKDTDSFGTALSGISYVLPEHYATAYGPERDKIWSDFLRLTNQYMIRLDQRWIWSAGVGPIKGQNFYDYARSLSNLTAVFDTRGGTTYKNANHLIEGVAVFHAINRWGKRVVLESDILSQVADRTPAFLHIILGNWDYSYDDIKQLADSFPENFALVRPEELAQLYRIYKGESQNKKD